MRQTRPKIVSGAATASATALHMRLEACSATRPKGLFVVHGRPCTHAYDDVPDHHQTTALLRAGEERPCR